MNEADTQELERLNSAIIRVTHALDLARAWARDVKLAYNSLYRLHQHLQGKAAHPLVEFLPVLLRSSTTLRQKLVKLVLGGFKRSVNKAIAREKRLEHALKKLERERDALTRATIPNAPATEPIIH